MSDLTPKRIVEELNRYIVGQDQAKRAVAVALCNRERRRKLDPQMQREVTPKNIILIGPTGVGKTEIARRMAALVNAPFVKVEATKFTEVGYVGRDVDSIVSELVESAVMKVYEEKLKEVEHKAESIASERLLNYVCQQLGDDTKKPVAPAGARRRKRDKQAMAAGTCLTVGPAPGRTASGRTRQKVSSMLQTRQLDDQLIEIEVYEEPEPMPSYGDYGGWDAYDPKGEMAEGGEPARSYSGQKRRRRVSVREARRILTREEANKLLDYGQVVDNALREVEEDGVVFVDEMDKLVGPRVEVGRDVSGEGVQRDLLPLVEGTTVMTRYGPVKTDHVLFIAAGCFYRNKPSELIPELQGRFPLRVELDALSQEDLKRILMEPENSLTRQYQALLETERVNLEFTEDGISEIARLATVMNHKGDNIGARRLNTIVEKTLEDANFSAPEHAGETITVDSGYVSQHVGGMVKDDDLSRYIL